MGPTDLTRDVGGIGLQQLQLSQVPQVLLVARAFGWTPPATSTSGLISSPSSITPSESAVPLEEGDSGHGTVGMSCENMSSCASGGLATPLPGTPVSAVSTNDMSAATDHQAKGGNGSDGIAGRDTLSCSARRQLRLGNGVTLSFTKEEVSDPPAISFSGNIPLLIQMWDDRSDDWDPINCVLHIQGQPIALIHWRDVYMYGKVGQWKGIQNRWTDWQVCPGLSLST